MNSDHIPLTINLKTGQVEAKINFASHPLKDFIPGALNGAKVYKSPNSTTLYKKYQADLAAASKAKSAKNAFNAAVAQRKGSLSNTSKANARSLKLKQEANAKQAQLDKEKQLRKCGFKKSWMGMWSRNAVGDAAAKNDASCTACTNSKSCAVPAVAGRRSRKNRSRRSNRTRRN